MGLTVGEVNVILEAETDQFNRKFGAAEKRIGKFEQQAERTADRGTSKLAGGLRGLASGFAAIGAAAGVGTLVALAKQTAAFGANLALTADRIGFTVESLQELRFAAGQTGVQTRQLDIGLQRFSRRLAEAASGGGETLGTFQALGIQLRDTNGNIRTSRDVLGDVANAIRDTTDPAEQLRIAFKLFDAEGAALVNTLRDGNDGLLTFAATARDAGIIIEEGMARRLQVLDDRLDKAGKTIKAQTVPVLADLAESFANVTEFAASAAKAVGNFVTGIGDVELGGATQEDLQRLNREAGATSAEIDELSASIERLEEVQEQAGLPSGNLAALKSQRRALQALNVDQMVAIRSVLRNVVTLREEAAAREDAATATEKQTVALTEQQKIELAQVAGTGGIDVEGQTRVFREQFFRAQRLKEIREAAIGDIERAAKAADGAQKARDEDRKKRVEEIAKIQQSAAESLIRLNAELNQQASADPLIQRTLDLDSQIAEAQRQIGALSAAPGADPARMAGEQALTILTAQRAENEAKITDLRATNNALLSQSRTQIEAVRGVDEVRANVLDDQLTAIVAQATSVEDLRRQLLEFVSGTFAGLEAPEAARSFGDTLSENVSGFLTRALEGEVDSFGELLLNTVQEATSEGLAESFADAQAGLSSLLSRGLSGGAGALAEAFGGEGGFFGGIANFAGSEGGKRALNNALGLGVSAVQAFRRGTEKEAQALGASSAVTSVQQVRGVVAGPTSIGIAQVQRGIGDAFIETNVILSRIDRNTAATAANTGGAGGSLEPAPGTSSDLILATESASLV